MRYMFGALAILVTGTCTFGQATPPVPQDNFSVASDVIKNAIRSHGGINKLAEQEKTYSRTQVKILKASFIWEDWTDLPLRRKTLARSLDPGGVAEHIQVIVGKEAWERVNGGAVRALSAEELERNVEALYVQRLRLLVRLHEKEFTMALVPLKYADALANYSVRVSSPNHADVHLFLDKKSALLTRVSTEATSPAIFKGKMLDLYLSDYRDFGGAMIPTKRVTKIGGQEFMEHHVLEFRTVKEFPANTFAKP